VARDMRQLRMNIGQPLARGRRLRHGEGNANRILGAPTCTHEAAVEMAAARPRAHWETEEETT
jgi:hypothetical protein